jgi:hypothetical protein
LGVIHYSEAIEEEYVPDPATHSSVFDVLPAVVPPEEIPNDPPAFPVIAPPNSRAVRAADWDAHDEPFQLWCAD